MSWIVLPPHKIHRLPRWFRGKEFTYNAGDAGDSGLIPGLGWSPGGRNGNPLQYSWLGNPMNRGAWRAIAHGVAKSRTWLSNWTELKTFLLYRDANNLGCYHQRRKQRPKLCHHKLETKRDYIKENRLPCIHMAHFINPSNLCSNTVYLISPVWKLLVPTYP